MQRQNSVSLNSVSVRAQFEEAYSMAADTFHLMPTKVEGIKHGSNSFLRSAPSVLKIRTASFVARNSASKAAGGKSSSTKGGLCGDDRTAATASVTECCSYSHVSEASNEDFDYCCDLVEEQRREEDTSKCFEGTNITFASGKAIVEEDLTEVCFDDDDAVSESRPVVHRVWEESKTRQQRKAFGDDSSSKNNKWSLYAPLEVQQQAILERRKQQQQEQRCQRKRSNVSPFIKVRMKAFEQQKMTHRDNVPVAPKRSSSFQKQREEQEPSKPRQPKKEFKPSPSIVRQRSKLQEFSKEQMQVFARYRAKQQGRSAAPTKRRVSSSLAARMGAFEKKNQEK